MRIKTLLCIAGLILFLKPGALIASMHEQLAIDVRAMALGNAVTADPPGIMSMHYNPAGLSNLPEGSQMSMSTAVLSIDMESRFKTNPEFKGYLPGGYLDPLADTSGSTTGFILYIPGYENTITLPATTALPNTGGISYRAPDSDYTFAFGVYSPMVGGFSRKGEDNALQYGFSELYWQHLTPSISASYQATPTMSFGLSVGFGVSALGISSDLRLPNALVAITRILGEATEGLSIPPLTELTLPPPWFGGGVHPYDRVASLDIAGTDNFAPSFNLGFLWEPYDWFSFGIVYHSEIKQEITGKYSMPYSDDFQSLVGWMGSSPLLIIASTILNLPITPVAAQTGTFTTEMIVPRMIQTGIKLKPFDFVSLLFDFNWAQWSIRTEDHIVFDQEIQALRVAALLGHRDGPRDLVLKRDLKDSLNYGVGLEITPLDWLTLRFGYEKRFSSVPIENFDTLWQFPDWDVYSTGLGVKFKNGISIDVSASYMKSKTLKVKANESNLMNNTTFTHAIYNPYAGLDYEQDFDIFVAGVQLRAPISVVNKTAGKVFEKIGKTISFLNPF